VCNDLQNLSKNNRNSEYQAVKVDESWVFVYEAEKITSRIFKPYHRRYWTARKSVPEMLPAVEDVPGLV
jgi:hypothetical protein